MYDFWIPLLLIFAVATVAAITARRRRDRCLKFFHRHRVMILMNSGKRLWGNLITYPKVLELEFADPAPDELGLRKVSYVLYPPEIDGIHQILQQAPKVGAEGYEAWAAEIQQVANPSLGRRFRRACWNAFNTLRDAVSQSLAMVLGTLKSKTPMGKVAGADKRAGEIGETLLGTIPNAYEPILEKYLSKEVVVEMLEGTETREYCGLLQEYSEKYVLLRSVPFKPEFFEGDDVPDHFDIIFPRSQALVRHRLMPET